MDINMDINLLPKLAKIVLRINPFIRLKVMCRGYSEDLEGSEWY